jgi:hypothetical protein
LTPEKQHHPRLFWSWETVHRVRLRSHLLHHLSQICISETAFLVKPQPGLGNLAIPGYRELYDGPEPFRQSRSPIVLSFTAAVLTTLFVNDVD